MQLRVRASGDPLSTGLSMVNWLVLMLLMSAFMLAATLSDSAPAGQAAQIGGAASMTDLQPTR